MRVLAFDTATTATAVAVLDVDTAGRPVPDGLSLEARDDPAPGSRPGHARRLLALIEALLPAAGGWPAIERIAVGTGPGTFTGLRIGIATAHGLARGRGLPLVGVSTLAALGLAAREADPAPALLAAIDARRGEAFAAAWSPGADPAAEPPRLAPAVLAPDALVAWVSALAEPPLAVGDGAVKFRAALEPAGITIPADASGLHRVTARAHCRLAAAIEPGAPKLVLPTYLRAPDAELSRPS